jgi:hypothetical protein
LGEERPRRINPVKKHFIGFFPLTHTEACEKTFIRRRLAQTTANIRREMSRIFAVFFSPLSYIPSINAFIQTPERITRKIFEKKREPNPKCSLPAAEKLLPKRVRQLPNTKKHQLNLNKQLLKTKQHRLK